MTMSFILSRIVGLAESIEHWDLLPNLNFYLHSVRDMLLLCFMEIGSFIRQPSFI